MQLFHHYHYHFSLHRFLHSEFWLFEASVWLHVFGRSLISVFIPILLLTSGYSVGTVMVYYFVYNLFDVPLNFVARWLVRKVGARLVIVAGSLSSIAFFVVLFRITPENWPLLVLLAFLSAFYDAMYWVAHLFYFIESSRARRSTSKDTSILDIVRRIAGMLAPVFGAAILIFLGQQILIIFSILFLALSIWPLAKMESTRDKPTDAQLSFREFFKDKRDIRDYLAVSFFGLHGATDGIIWPLFIFFVFETFESVAAIPVIVALTTIVFTYFAGRVRKRNRSNTLILGSLLVAGIWILRLFIANAIFYYVSIFLIGIFSVLVSIPMDSGIFEQGQKKDSLSASMYRNVFSMGLRAPFYGFLALLINVFNVSFIIAATAMIVVVAVTVIINRAGASRRSKGIALV